jgi:hypothetical protein
VPSLNLFQFGQTAENKVYAYHWKMYNFKDKQFKEVHSEHPYCKEPAKNMNQLFLLLHLSDTY